MVCPQKTQRVADVSMQFMTFVEDDPFPEELLQDRESELCPRPFRVLEVEEASPDVLLRCLEKVEGCTLQRFEEVSFLGGFWRVFLKVVSRVFWWSYGSYERVLGLEKGGSVFLRVA